MNEMLPRPAVDVQGRLESQGVRYALASYATFTAARKCKVVPIGHLDQMLNGSELFTGAALDGVPQEVNDDEVAAIPDPASATVLPWKSETAWFASDLWLNGRPFEACSRGILKTGDQEAADMGYALQSRHRDGILPVPRDGRRIRAARTGTIRWTSRPTTCATMLATAYRSCRRSSKP